MDLREKDGLALVKVNRDKLIEKLKENRKKHQQEYTEAVNAYQDACVKELQDALKKVRGWKSYEDYDVVQVSNYPPTHHLKDYDRVLASLEMSVDQDLVITAAQVSQFVMDEWNWSEQFRNSTSNYKVEAAAIVKGRL